MKSMSGKDLARLLEKNGWQLARVHGSHHVYIQEGKTERISVPIYGN
jgi:predicted RNA binding protein YcfA (HicA-like mRNA interferase family)